MNVALPSRPARFFKWEVGLGAPPCKFPESDKFHADFGFTRRTMCFRRALNCKQFSTDRRPVFSILRLKIDSVSQSDQPDIARRRPGVRKIRINWC